MMGSLRRCKVPGLALAGFGLCLILGSNLAQSGQRNDTGPTKAEQSVGDQGERSTRIRTVPRASSKPAPRNAAEVPASKPSSVTSPSTAWTAAEPGSRACFKSRRRLWQDGEGWIVKMVTVCP